MDGSLGSLLGVTAELDKDYYGFTKGYVSIADCWRTSNGVWKSGYFSVMLTYFAMYCGPLFQSARIPCPLHLVNVPSCGILFQCAQCLL